MDPRLLLRLRLLLHLETSSWYCVMKLSRVSFRRFFFFGQLGEGGHLKGECGITLKHTHTQTLLIVAFVEQLQICVCVFLLLLLLPLLLAKKNVCQLLSRPLPLLCHAPFPPVTTLRNYVSAIANKSDAARQQLVAFSSAA